MPAITPFLWFNDKAEEAARNGGSRYTFTPSVSFLVPCETQQEVDYYWDKLTYSGKPIQCGWLEDKYGLSWQIVPKELFRLVQDKDPARSQRVMKAMLQMVKLDLARLQQAANES